MQIMILEALKIIHKIEKRKKKEEKFRLLP